MKTFFRSWYDTVKHSEVAMFTSELLSDPLPVGCHLYVGLRDTAYGTTGKDRADSFYEEAGLSVPTNLFHNKWINHYNHKDDDEAKRPRDITPVHIPSKHYVFDYMKETVECDIKQRNQRNEECSLSIYMPDDVTVAGSLLPTARTISQHQAINILRVVNFECKDTHVGDVFNISDKARSVSLRGTTLPPRTMNNLIQQINKCNTIQQINFHGTNLRPISSLVLSNKRSLTDLDLSESQMSPELVNNICGQSPYVLHR